MEDQTPVIVIEQQDEKRRRGGLVWLLALAFVAVLAVGGTFAYLTYTTNQASNRITTDPVITADLVEPAWSKAANEDNTGTTKYTDSSDGYYIPKAASNMIPSSVVAKDPKVVNTSTNYARVYAGIKAQFQVWNGTAYTNMSAKQVADTLAIYGLSTASDTTTPGFTLGDNWTQITDYGTETPASVEDADKATAKFTVDANGAMYFYNSEALDAMTTDAVVTGDDWGAAAASQVGVNNKSVSTSNLFSHIRFLDAATQGQIDQFNVSVLASKSQAKKDKTSTGTVDKPGWRILLTGGVIQCTVDGSGNVTNQAATYASNTATAGITWKSVLDGTVNDNASGHRQNTDKTGYVPTATTEPKA